MLNVTDYVCLMLQDIRLLHVTGYIDLLNFSGHRFVECYRTFICGILLDIYLLNFTGHMFVEY